MLLSDVYCSADVEGDVNYDLGNGAPVSRQPDEETTRAPHSIQSMQVKLQRAAAAGHICS